LAGDLVDDPGTEVYNLLAEKLSGLKIPYLPMVGNHDDREMVKACLSVPELNSGSFIQYVVMAGGWRLIMLDTVKSGQMDGEICDERLQWLRAELEKDQKSPTLIFSHHPLVITRPKVVTCASRYEPRFKGAACVVAISDQLSVNNFQSPTPTRRE